MVFYAINARQHVFGLCCGITKEFDIVDRDLLISKLERYGIEEYHWIGLSPILSAEYNMLKYALVIKQGSILGPLLFVLYITVFFLP